MHCTEAYREHIMYTFYGFCKTAIRFAAISARRDWNRRQKEISLEYLEYIRTIPMQIGGTSWEPEMTHTGIIMDSI